MNRMCDGYFKHITIRAARISHEPFNGSFYTYTDRQRKNSIGSVVCIKR